MYSTLKYLHVLCVSLSIGGFVWRGLLMMRGSPLLNARWVKTLPHVIDSVLLATAIALATMSAQYPFAAPWVTAKVLGLCAYIVLGALALKRAPTRGLRIASWWAALVVFGWIVSVALTKSPAGFFA